MRKKASPTINIKQRLIFFCFSGTITTLKKLDYETQSVYILIVRARSVYTPHAYQDVHVRIAVQDANDNYPKFKEDMYKTSIRENSIVNREIIKVSGIVTCISLL